MEVEDEGVTCFTLDGGLEITRYGKYIGLYMEDGSDEFVTNVMMIEIYNGGASAVQYAKITLTDPAGDAVFTLTTLLPDAEAEDDLVKAVLAEYEVAEDVARRDIGEFLEQLRKMHII